jgi:hypothetical protein
VSVGREPNPLGGPGRDFFELTSTAYLNGAAQEVTGVDNSSNIVAIPIADATHAFRCVAPLNNN